MDDFLDKKENKLYEELKPLETKPNNHHTSVQFDPRSTAFAQLEVL
jgi:hypothetical protein